MIKKPTPTKGKEKFNLQDIKELISLLRRNNIWEFDLEQNGTKIRIVTGQSDKAKLNPEAILSGGGSIPVHHYQSVVPVIAAPAARPPMPTAPSEVAAEANGNNKAAAVEPAKPAEKELAEENMLVIKSPMVGTFYRAPSPDAPPYVEVGDAVKENTVLCIIEAMKLMNEIKAECTGKIAKILVENGQPVEYGQQIFLIEPGT